MEDLTVDYWDSKTLSHRRNDSMMSTYLGKGGFLSSLFHSMRFLVLRSMVVMAEVENCHRCLPFDETNHTIMQPSSLPPPQYQ